MSRMFRFTSRDYYSKHVLDYFGTSLATSMIAQPQKVGYVRSDQDREKVAQYGKRRLDNAINLGLYPLLNQVKDKKQVVEKATNILRERYISKKPSASATTAKAEVSD